ncbi:MAG: hypothetical protein HY559_00870 [Gammaproteobacteria bacterium]|nr:hypothetical protein [Gammaproteobacteria bacterium]
MPKTKATTELAKRYVWWRSSHGALQHPEILIATIMNQGTWNDIQLLRKTVGNKSLRQVLKQAPPGCFHYRSWDYWHHKFHMSPIPKLPKRKFA